MTVRRSLAQLSIHMQVPKRYYFTRQVALGSHRNVIAQYGLPQRVYLGPTSMDTEMAFIMCNQAQVCFSLPGETEQAHRIQHTLAFKP